MEKSTLIALCVGMTVLNIGLIINSIRQYQKNLITMRKLKKSIEFSKKLDLITMYNELGKFTEFIFNEFYRDDFIAKKSIDNFKFSEDEVRELSIQLVIDLNKLIKPEIFQTYIKYLNITETQFQEILLRRVRKECVSLFTELNRKGKTR